MRSSTLLLFLGLMVSPVYAIGVRYRCDCHVNQGQRLGSESNNVSGDATTEISLLEPLADSGEQATKTLTLDDFKLKAERGNDVITLKEVKDSDLLPGFTLKLSLNQRSLLLTLTFRPVEMSKNPSAVESSALRSQKVKYKQIEDGVVPIFNEELDAVGSLGLADRTDGLSSIVFATHCRLVN